MIVRRSLLFLLPMALVFVQTLCTGCGKNSKREPAAVRVLFSDLKQFSAEHELEQLRVSVCEADKVSLHEFLSEKGMIGPSVYRLIESSGSSTDSWVVHTSFRRYANDGSGDLTGKVTVVFERRFNEPYWRITELF